MYVDDPSVAFGSWCVKGRGRLMRYVIQRPYTDFEQERIDSFLEYLPASDLYLMLHTAKDPRYQRVIQEAYERKSRYD